MKTLEKFRYDSLTYASRVIVQQRTSEIKTLMRKTASDIIEIGHKLIEVKEELPHGEFGVWLDAEFGWSWKTANNFMNVATKFETVTNLDGFAHRALYMLSEPSTPEPARQEAIERAEQGEPIDHSTAKQIKKKHSGPEIRPEYEERAEEINRIIDEQLHEEPEELESVGIEKAQLAVSILNQIPSDDKEFDEAVGIVKNWLELNETEII